MGNYFYNKYLIDFVKNLKSIDIGHLSILGIKCFLIYDKKDKKI